MKTLPLFSIVLAFRNEGGMLAATLRSIDEQSISRCKWEMILVDGMSDDNSKAIATTYVSSIDNGKLLLNPRKIVTSGWNIGIENASGSYIVIVSGHSLMEKSYLEKAENILIENPQIKTLCGRIEFVGRNGTVTESIASMMNSVFALGSARYRSGNSEGLINQISYGIYARTIFQDVGMYDERLGRCGDWEFSHRLCRLKVDIYFDPVLKAAIFCRSDFGKLFVQQFRTGFWKARIWLTFGSSIRVRHVIPFIYVFWLFSLPWLLLGREKMLIVIWLLILPLYAGGILISVGKGKGKGVLKMLVFPTIHLGYGLGSVIGLGYWLGSLLRVGRWRF